MKTGRLTGVSSQLLLSTGPWEFCQSLKTNLPVRVEGEEESCDSRSVVSCLFCGHSKTEV